MAEVGCENENFAMASLEDEIRDLREKNSELAQEVQSLKILAAQKDREKLELTKEINDLRLKISRLRSGGAAQARKLDAGLQAASEEALSHMVQASGAVARTMEIVKQFIQERQELESTSPRWSNLGISNGEKVNKVPPLMLGGQSIQPVVSLSRTMLNNRSLNRSPNQSNGVTQRALPMHMLQDVYIPLTRIDAAELQANGLEAEENLNGDNSAEDLGLQENEEQPDLESEDSQQISELDESRGLEAVLEESGEQEEDINIPEPQQAVETSQILGQNPLEGPSWLLDAASASSSMTEESAMLQSHSGSNLEPDSTTPNDTPAETPARPQPSPQAPAQTELEGETEENASVCMSLAFTPTVRRRKRTISPTELSPRKHSIGRVLKVVISKMRLSDEDLNGSSEPGPPKRPALQVPKSPRRSVIDVGDTSPRSKETKQPRFDAPSPNGATDSGVIVCETNHQPKQSTSHAAQPSTSNPRVSRRDSLLDVPNDIGIRGDSRNGSRSASRQDYSDGESNASAGDQESRGRRTRKQVSYKEKPLNRSVEVEYVDNMYEQIQLNEPRPSHDPLSTSPQPSTQSSPQPSPQPSLRRSPVVQSLSMTSTPRRRRRGRHGQRSRQRP